MLRGKYQVNKDFNNGTIDMNLAIRVTFTGD